MSMAEPAPLRPLQWPPAHAWNDEMGRNERVIPVVDGGEATLSAVYVVAPTKARQPSKIGYTQSLSRRLLCLRNAWSYASDDRLCLFWVAWFIQEQEARQVECV